MQDVKHFVQGKDFLTLEFDPTPLEDQINAFLKKHQNYSIRSMSTIVGVGYKEAFVVFDVREERTEKHDRPQKQMQALDVNK